MEKKNVRRGGIARPGEAGFAAYAGGFPV